MLFRTHFVVAFFVFLISFSFFEDTLIFGLFFLFATLFVDIDSKKSRMGKILIFRPLQFFFKHRGIIHSIFLAVILSTFIFLFNSSAGFGFLIGYLVHLLIDSLSFSGVCLFWPLSNKKFKGFVKTGGILEEIIFVLLLLLDIYLLGKIALNIVFLIT